MIPYGRQFIVNEDIEAVVEVLKSKMLTQGPAIPRFENDICNYVGAKYGVAVNSATSALHISCLALGLDSDSILWTVPNTFVSSANVGLFCGAKVDFVDIDPNTYLMCMNTLKRKLEKASKDGLLPKIVMPVHFAGQSADMKILKKLSLKYGFKILEDASHAIGGNYLEQKIGGCQYSDITVFSFHPVKIITTGEGGIALTNNEQLNEKLVLFRSHGVTRQHKLMETRFPEPWVYDQISLGFNYRITDIQAALGSSQLKRLDEIVKRRTEIAQLYNSELSNLEIKLPKQCEKGDSSFHLYPICVNDRKRVYDGLQSAGINVNVHYIPIHLQPFWKKKGYNIGDFPNSENYYSRAISIPIYFGLKDSELDFVISQLKKLIY